MLMNKFSSYAKTNWSEFRWIMIFIAAIWLGFIADIFLPLEKYGLVPRQLNGISGIFTMHFLHGNWQHIISNFTPLIVLLVLLAGSKSNSASIIVAIGIIGGFILWLIGRSSIHIGASLLVFGLASFLVVTGIIEKRVISLIISVIVLFTFGSSLITGLLPFQPGISWEGHLSGMVAGILCAFIMTSVRRKST